MKVDYEELLGYYKVVRYGKPGDGEYEDAIEAILDAVPELIKMYREADDEAADANNAWQKVRRENLALREQVRELEQKNAALEDRVRYLIEERDGLEWAISFSSSKEYCE